MEKHWKSFSPSYNPGLDGWTECGLYLSWEHFASQLERVTCKNCLRELARAKAGDVRGHERGGRVMGTRADFYVGRGEGAEWLGSIALDGYPSGLDQPVLAASEETEFRYEVTAFLGSRSDATVPDDGWPWPWNDSRTTDYAFDGGQVWASCFGREWFPADGEEPDYDEEDVPKTAVFPDISARKNVTLGRRSGLIVLERHGHENSPQKG